MATADELQEKIKNGPANIKDGQVETKHLRDSSITGAKIVPGTIDVTDVSVGSPGSSAPGDTVAPGTATSLVRSDHRHGREAFATVTELDVVNAAGEAAGTSATVPHGDHKHQASVADPAASAPGDSMNQGASNSLSRADHQHAREASQTPTGMISAYGASTAPTGWVLCDGASLLRAGTYAALFAIIGTLYGSVDGTHFNVPDLRGRFPAGKDAATFTPMGSTGGEETHTLTIAEMAAHDHGGATSGPNNQVDDASGTARALPAAGAASAFLGTHAHTIPSQGDGGAHENKPPYQVVQYIIKI